MAARDVIHDAVKNALVKDGWAITDDPLRLKYKAVNLSVDLGAIRSEGSCVEIPSTSVGGVSGST